MIRYLWLNISGILMLILLLGEASMSTPMFTTITWAGIGVILSVPILYVILPRIRNKLVQNKNSLLDRRPPTGVWFFLSIGAVGGLLAATISSISGKQILTDLLLLCLSVLISSFTAIGIHILLLERRHKKKAYLRFPDGMIFLD
jgi:hypothetical protein